MNPWQDSPPLNQRFKSHGEDGTLLQPFPIMYHERILPGRNHRLFTALLHLLLVDFEDICDTFTILTMCIQRSTEICRIQNRIVEPLATI